MNVLIVGANGFFGSHLVKKCLFNKWNTTCIYHPNRINIPDDVLAYPYKQIGNLKSDFD